MYSLGFQIVAFIKNRKKKHICISSPQWFFETWQKNIQAMYESEYIFRMSTKSIT